MRQGMPSKSQAHRENVLKALAPWPDPDDVLSKPFWKMVPGDVDALRRILSQDSGFI